MSVLWWSQSLWECCTVLVGEMLKFTRCKLRAPRQPTALRHSWPSSRLLKVTQTITSLDFRRMVNDWKSGILAGPWVYGKKLKCSHLKGFRRFNFYLTFETAVSHYQNYTLLVPTECRICEFRFWLFPLNLEVLIFFYLIRLSLCSHFVMVSLFSTVNSLQKILKI